MRRVLALSLLAVAMATHAVIETYEFDDPSLQTRFKVLAAELRCPKCQNQNIADSNAPIAADLRKQLHAQLHAGASDTEIVDYMVSRYGEFVLYRPRMNSVTAALWLAPAILLLLATAVVLLSVRRRTKSAGSPLTPEERSTLDAMLRDQPETDDV
ncbi:MAG: cytochrome c-type biogenesis protein [Pseudomonadota bacterium]